MFDMDCRLTIVKLVVDSTANSAADPLSISACGYRPDTRSICRRKTPIVGRLLLVDFIVFRILNMFNKESRPTITELVVESADSIAESADSTADSAANPLKIGLWVLALKAHTHTPIFVKVCGRIDSNADSSTNPH